MLSAHGSYKLSFDEESAVFKCTFSGAWNAETVILLARELSGYKLPAKWTSLGVFEDFEGMLPEAVEIYKSIIDKSTESGLCANAIVCNDSSVEFFLDSLISYRQNNHVNTPMKKFDNEVDARTWLIEMTKLA